MRALATSLLILLLVGCDIPDRVSRLEKQAKEIQSEKDRVADYDLQAKCSKDARVWFKENWPSDKDTALLDFTNHYNKKQNKCFILVEYHYNSNLVAGTRGSSWTNIMTLWNLYENSKYGSFAENHYSYFKPEFSSRDEVTTCEVTGQKCKTIYEFNNLSRPSMNE